jgi:RNA polymerase sigma factor (sigma-70 family)
MSAEPTRASLLVRLRDPRDAEAWERFVRIYSPLVFRLAQRTGLQDADAADITQDVLHSVHRGIDRFVYDPAKGTFRSWLRTVARARIADAVERRRRQPVAAGGSAMVEFLSDHPSPDGDEVWERDYRQALFEAATEKVRGEFRGATFRAFWETAVKGREPNDVARELAMTSGAVYIARSRVTSRLREVITVWEREAT